MANPKINISSLDFDGIKTSLKTYLSSLPNFQGYDFEGSGIDTLLGIMAYNTLYYSFYSNMIANETYLDTAQLENNIISLVKPLGYLVTGKSCAKSDVSATSIATSYTLAAYTNYLSGYSNTGSTYKFYPIQDTALTSGLTADFTVYEAKTVVRDLPATVDITEQKAFLGTTDIDLNTLTVKVNGEVWNKYNNYEPNPGPDSLVYFIDRTANGFYIIFGKKTLNDYQSTFGKTVGENDIVTVSYLIPSGTNANGISLLTNNSLNTIVSTTTANGTDVVDLDLVKFFAPKMFAANDRAVTKDDFYGLLLSSNILPASIATKDQINVWGREEADPPAFGRVFVSFADTALTTETPSVKKSIAYLKNKSVVTVLPEYVQPQPIGVALNVSIFGTGSEVSVAAIKALLETTYNTNTFNNYFSATDVKTTITEKYPTVRNVNVTKATLTTSITGSSGDKVINFKNQLKSATTTNTITSDPFVYGSTTVTLINKPNDTTGALIAKDVNTTPLAGETVGFIDYTRGIITINPAVIPLGTTITLTAETQYTDYVQIKDELLSTLTATVVKG